MAIIDWPKAIHDGNGRAVFVVPPEVTEEQLGCLAQIFTGQLGGMPWEILGTTFEVVTPRRYCRGSSMPPKRGR